MNAISLESLKPKTAEKPINIAEWSKWFNFDTCGDPQLVKMLEASARFVLSIRNREKPRWLSLVGTSGAGKSYLAKRIHRYVRETNMFPTGLDARGEIAHGHEFVTWTDIAKELQGGGAKEWIRDLGKLRFVTLDDIGAVRDGTGFVTGELSVLLGIRTGKWTVITANYGLAEIADKIDPRVASRMIRDGSVVVDVDVTDYALRAKQ